MKITFTNLGKRTQVRIDDIAGDEKPIAEAVRKCRQSSWACPSGECRNIESIEERLEPGCVVLTITPRDGAQINYAGMEECLRYML